MLLVEKHLYRKELLVEHSNRSPTTQHPPFNNYTDDNHYNLTPFSQINQVVFVFHVFEISCVVSFEYITVRLHLECPNILFLFLGRLLKETHRPHFQSELIGSKEIYNLWVELCENLKQISKQPSRNKKIVVMKVLGAKKLASDGN